MRTPSPSYSITLRIEIVNQVGMFGKIATTIGERGGDIGPEAALISLIRNIGTL